MAKCGIVSLTAGQKLFSDLFNWLITHQSIVSLCQLLHKIFYILFAEKTNFVKAVFLENISQMVAISPSNTIDLTVSLQSYLWNFILPPYESWFPAIHKIFPILIKVHLKMSDCSISFVLFQMLFLFVTLNFGVEDMNKSFWFFPTIFLGSKEMIP